MTTLTGTVGNSHINQNGEVVGYDIEVNENGTKKTYFAHLGDLKENETLLYQDQRTVHLQQGQNVEFEPWVSNKEKAIRVRIKS